MASRDQAVYYRVAIAGPCAQGSASLEWRIREALEALGHTAFVFCPALQPWLFDETGDIDTRLLGRFLRVQQVDFLLLAQGCLTQAGVDVPDTCAVGLLASDAGRLSGRAEAVAASGAGFALLVCDGPAEGLPGVVRLEPHADAAWARTPLANTLFRGPGVLCLQDASEDAVAFMRDVRGNVAEAGLTVRCVGADWPDDLALPLVGDPFDNAFAYAARSSVACVEAPGAGRPDVFACALAAAEGLPVVRTTSAEEACRAILDAAAGWRPHELPVSGAGEGISLEEGLASALGQVRQLLAPGQAPGVSDPRVMACAMAYVGRGNFGDEYIYQTVGERLRAAYPGAALVAVSEDPRHTLSCRGTYAIDQTNAALLDFVLARSSVALVLAGLLFDQGIRWTMGKAEVFGQPSHSDIPGIAAFVALAKLNDTPTVLYGIGAGPLENDDSRRLVRLMGSLGARFETRDEETTRLLCSCGVSDVQVVTRADVAFLGSTRPVASVDEWVGAQVPAGNGMLAVSLREYETTPPDFADRVAWALDHFVGGHPGVTPVFCVVDPGDESLSRQVIERMRRSTQARLFAPGDNLDALADLLSRCRLGLSMRYHCSLVLMRSGVPACGLDYLPKVGSLYRELDAEDVVLPADASAEDILGTLLRLEEEHDARGRRVRRAARAMARRAEGAERTLLSQVDSHRGAKQGPVGTSFFIRDVPDAEVRRLEEAGRQREYAASLECERDDLRAQNERLRTELEAARAEVAAVRGSTSYRVGNAAVRPLAKVRNALRRGE